MALMPGSDDVILTNPGLKLTYDDFVQFPDDGKRHELIDGEHYVTPSPNREHQKVSGNMHLMFGLWLEDHPILTDANVQGAPEIVIEIGSESTRKRDETIKRLLYERSGVSEHWVVDPEIDVIRVYRRVADGFDRPVECRADTG